MQRWGGDIVSKARNGPESFRKQAGKLERWTGGQALCVFVGSGEAVGVLCGRVGYRVCTQKALSEGSVGS